MFKQFIGAIAISSVGAIGLLQAIAGDEEYNLGWHSIDCGGGDSSSGDGMIELSGTIGQHDAGPGSSGMTGGGFALTGGFRIRIVPGDCNIDGGINVFDFVKFDECATGPGGKLPAASCACIDFDSDGDVDVVDYGTMQTRFSGP